MGFFSNLLGAVSGAPFLGALVQGATSLFGGQSNQQNQNHQNEINRQWQEYMMDKQNAYNSPLAQRLRLDAAGINPMMQFGHGQIANTSASAPSGNAQAVPIDYGGATRDAIGTYMSLKGFEEQIESRDLEQQLMASNIEKNDAQTLLLGAQEGATRSRGMLDDFKRFQIDSTLGSFIENAKLRAENTRKLNLRLDIQNEQLSEKIRSEIMATYQQIENLKSQMSARDMKRMLDQKELELRKLDTTYKDGTIQRLLTKYLFPTKIATETLNKGQKLLQSVKNE